MDSLVTWTTGLIERIREALRVDKTSRNKEFRGFSAGSALKGKPKKPPFKERQMRNYRGWTKEGKEVHGWLFMLGDCAYIIPLSDDFRTPSSFVCGFVEVIPETVGQQTGFKDKNSTKIYQDDILSYAGFEGYLIVKWETFGWRLENTIPEIDRYIQRLSWPPIQLPSGNFEHIEVISTIHTHPKLMEQDNA